MTSREAKELERLQQNNVLPKKTDSIPWFCTCRWMLALVGFFGFLTAYSLRINLSLAMVCMINQTALVPLEGVINISLVSEYDNGTLYLVNPHQGEQCFKSSRNRTLGTGEFPWPKKTQGIVLSSFFWGYLLSQLPGGWLAQRFGGRRVIGYFMLVTAVSTLLSPAAARASPYLLMLMRILNGIGQGVIFPATTQLFAAWAPPLERSKLIGFTFAGTQIGNVITLPISAVLCDYGFDNGWGSIFYVLGIGGTVWVIIWLILVSDTPAQHPRITAEERDLIESSVGSSITLRTPWKHIFTSVPVWSLIIAHPCCMWGTYMLLTSMPIYMSEILKYDIKETGMFSALPYVIFWATINIGGVIADYMRSKGFPTKYVRKIMFTIGTVIPAVLLIATGYVSCRTPFVAVIILCLGLGCSGFQFPGIMVNGADIAPPFSGVLYGITNTVATLSGIFAPYTVGVLTPNSTQEEWRVVFYLTAAIYVFGAIVFALFADGVVQPWVRPFMGTASVDGGDKEGKVTILNGKE